MGRLTNPRTGFLAEYVRQRVGTSVVGQLRGVQRDVQRAKRTLTELRVPRGFILPNGQRVDFDADGRIQLLSTDSSETIERNPWGRKSVIDWRVTSPGCSAAWATIVTQDGTISASSCGEQIDKAGYHTAEVLRAYVSGVEGGASDYVRWRLWADVFSAIITPNKYLWVEKAGGAGWVKVPCLDDGSTPGDPGNNPGGGG